jgi:hypothetical protein
MKTPQKDGLHPSGQGGPNQAVRPVVKLFIGITCLACVGILVFHFAGGKTPKGQQAMQSLSTEVPSGKQRLKKTTAVVGKSTTTKQPVNFGGAVSHQHTPVAPPIYIEPTKAARKLVASLVKFDTDAGSALNEAQVAAWKENLRRLIQQGDAAVPAINEFLEKNADIKFGPENSGALGYTSARMAMIDALMQIGSSLAIGALDTVLQHTEGPQEIAMVTQYLEKNEPGQFLQHAFDAAQRLLGNVANGSLPNMDVAPLFQVFQQYEYGNAYTVPVLKDNAGQWNYYATIALARLPDEAGIPTLIQIASGQEGLSPGARTAALQALSGMASQSANARDALLDMARQNNLSAYDWSALVPFLAGSQMIYQSSTFGNPLSAANPNDVRSVFIPASNQSIFTLPMSSPTAEQMDFINRLMAATKDPAGTQALQQAKSVLESRLSALASSSDQ